MKIIVCLDDKNGMLFHNRRQSKDRVLIEKVLELTRDSTLWMHSYSQTLFERTLDKICVDDCFLEKAGQGEYCFVENADVAPYNASVEELIVFRWNRIYPTDLNFPIELLNDFQKRDEIFSFSGNSHDKITVEVYDK